MASRYEMYGMLWPNTIEPLERELECIRNKGYWKRSDGKMAGLGMFYHWKLAQEILWPEKVWHRWKILETECFLKYKYIAEMGCAAGGKSQTAAANALLTWYCWPNCTTIIVSSTEVEALENRIWGMIKQLHREAKERYDWLPGHLIESRRRIVYDPKSDSSEGRDFKNGLQGVPCKRGNNFQGLGSYCGIHNKRVFLFADELSLMPRALLDSVSNLSKCQHFKLVGLGNPKDTTDALGVLAEPAAHLGGWEGSIDQSPGTKTWETKFPNGICIQMPASDTPNNETELGKPWKYPFLVTPDQIKDDIEIWGKNSLHFTMMSEARMPRGQSSRRIITRLMCLKFHAFEEPVWKSDRRTAIAFLDAAYRGTGGDRCVFGVLEFGEQVDTIRSDLETPLISRLGDNTRAKTIIALKDMMVVPIDATVGAHLPEYQIAHFVKRECENRGIPPENFFFDSTGRGSLMSAFAKEWDAHVIGVEFGGPATERPVSNEIRMPCREYYANMVTELWNSVRLAVEAEQVRGLNEEVVRELSMREWKYVGKNRIQVETKEEMKEKSGRSPDLADGLVVGLEGARQRGFQIARLTSLAAIRLENKWKRDLRDRSRQAWQDRVLEYAA